VIDLQSGVCAIAVWHSAHSAASTAKSLIAIPLWLNPLMAQCGALRLFS
jgi:hypothetical protein